MEEGLNNTLCDVTQTNDGEVVHSACPSSPEVLSGTRGRTSRLESGEPFERL